MLNNLKRFLEPTFVENDHFFSLILAPAIFSSYILFNVFFIQKIVNLIENWYFESLLMYILIYILVSMFYFIFSIFIRHWWWAKSFFHMNKVIHNDYMNRFNRLDNTYIENIWTWKALSIISKWIDTWVKMIIDSLYIFVRLLVWIIATFFILWSFGVLYVLWFLFIFIILNILIYYLNKWALYWRKWRIENAIEYDRQLVKMIMSKFEILQSNNSKKEIQVLDKYADNANYYNIGLNNYLFAMFSLPNFIFFLLTLSILFYILNNDVSYSVIVWVFMLISILKEIITNSIEFFKNFTKDIYQVEKMWDLFDNGPEIKWLDTWNNFEYKSWDISIKNLNFSYWNNLVFNNLSIDFKWWQKIAFVWASGWWKTTLVKIISWFIKANSWDIIIDNQNLSDINLTSYYKNIWYLTQEPSVFDWTILENLLYWAADMNVDMSIINEAILNAKCDFIYDLEKWLETQIGERWVRLSWWQKQRLAIAKLFIKNPKIIILDEPTSALDSFSEEAIKQSFDKLFIWKTVFIIAHRLQTVKTADDIIVFEWWNVIERWNHIDLLSKNWYYKRMLDLQSGF